MNLLEATTTLIDTAKTFAPENDRVVQRAIRRMEKRLFVLQVRSAKARKRNRINAFFDAMAAFDGGASPFAGKLRAVIPCKACPRLLTFSDFCRTGEFSGSGKVIHLTCPQCGCVMEKEAS